MIYFAAKILPASVVIAFPVLLKIQPADAGFQTAAQI